ncbi:MAG TPA: DUF1501 domain-containing protein [Blastocatellia bacterium]|nr:DUF1501 domain-containing protein [Blastocatellia bacterium]
MSSSRRNFLKQSLCAGLSASSAASILGSLTMTAAAVPAVQTSDFKALVCVFLGGGNDGDNTLIPYGQTEYNAYAAARTAIALPRANLLPITPLTSDGRSFALHPSVSELQTLFGQKKLAVVANVGPLLAPTTRTQFMQKSVPLPPQLYSHSDQLTHWQTSWPGETPKTGWGGRLADAMNAYNLNPQIAMSISLASANMFQTGSTVLSQMITNDGPINLWYYNEGWNYPGTNLTKAFLQQTSNNGFEQHYREKFKSAMANSERLSAALGQAPKTSTVFPDNKLAKQLQMIAKLISVQGQLGLRRQIFYCFLDGFDTHGDQLATQSNLLRQVSQSLDAFYKTTVELNVASNVTTFTASDFGRTYRSNGRGSDHGWGNHQFVLGGAVKGGDIYGKVPVQQINGPDDTTEGRWIPTIATDEYAATLATWFGVSAGDLTTVLPNLGRFARPNLGFMS